MSWLWQTLVKPPERLTEQELADLEALALDRKGEAYRRFLELLMWQTVSQMVSNQGSEQDRWRLQGEYEALRKVAHNWDNQLK